MSSYTALRYTILPFCTLYFTIIHLVVVVVVIIIVVEVVVGEVRAASSKSSPPNAMDAPTPQVFVSMRIPNQTVRRRFDLSGKTTTSPNHSQYHRTKLSVMYVCSISVHKLKLTYVFKPTQNFMSLPPERSR